ncbi:MAG: carboxy terminal-processing peptidase [Victivallales bacterium]|nr:carboxy terminal-processing peptidase [Victivallales bacterium]
MKMMVLFCSRLLIPALFVLAPLSRAFCGDGLEYDPEIGIIARVTATMLSEQQYRHRKTDDALSADVFDEYFRALDPWKFYFTKEDIGGFADQRLELDDQIKRGDVSFGFKVYDLLVRRMKEYADFASVVLGDGFDFMLDERVLLDRKDSDFPSASGQKDLWRRRLKNDYLTMLLVDRALTEDEAKTDEDKEKDKVVSLWRKPPKERILSRISSAANNLEARNQLDRLEFYLSALSRVCDPHSAYMAPSSVEDFDISMKLSLVGIGAVLTSEDGYTKIVSIIDGGPASKDGRLEAEDRIIAVSQGSELPVDVIDMPLSDVVRMIRGEKETVVNLTVLKGKMGFHGIPEIISLVRDVVSLEDRVAKRSVRKIKTSEGAEKNIGIIDLPSFYTDFAGSQSGSDDYRSSTRDVKRILEEFSAEGIDGVVLDLRRNGGGALREAILLSGLFFDGGPVVQIRSSETGAVTVESDTDGKTYYSGPLLVMIGRLSASAAEILAGAIQDHGRGLIVGDAHTHGKGTVQTIVDLDRIVRYYGVSFRAGSLKLTSAKFYRINGDSTQIKGITPDIVLPNLTDAMELGERHLEYALPWDSIKPASYDSSKVLVPLIPVLREKSGERVRLSQKFQQLGKNIDRFKEIRSRKDASLNMDVRWKEYKEERELLEKERTLLKEEDEDTKKGAEDIHLDEALNIMSDLLELK